MKTRFYFLLLLLVALPLQAQNTVKLMSYNIRNAKGMDDVCNYQRIANVILSEAPDVVAVQEVDSVTSRSHQVYVLGELAERTRMYASYAPAIAYKGGKYGVGILSKQCPLRTECVSLPGSEEARVMLAAEFDDYIMGCTHLSLTEADRIASYELIRAYAAQCTKPFFLAGDWNDTPHSSLLQRMQQDFILLNPQKAPTHPAPSPKTTIDYVALWRPTAPLFVVESAKVVDEPMASDHRPVSVSLRMAFSPERMMVMKPYLQNPSRDAITVMWETAIPAYSWVEYGTDTLHLKRARLLLDGQAVFDECIHKIRLDSLTPGATYYYRVCSQEILQYQAYRKQFGHTSKSDFFSFTLPAEDEDEFTAVVFNDLHKNAKTFEALCQQLQGIDYDFVLFNGDCIDDPAHHQQTTRFIRQLTERVGGSSVPVFFVRGNHEIRNAYSVGLRKHFDSQDGKTYFAFSWGDTRWVVLDCGEDKPDEHPVYYGLNDFSSLRTEQVAFLREELASKAFRKAEKRVLVHHIPLYGNDGKNLCEDMWKPLMQKARFDVSIHGHTHRYAFHPKGTLENPFPVVIGGGNTVETATVVIVHKTARQLQIKVVNAQGEVLLDIVV